MLNREREKSNLASHTLYRGYDADAPDQIKDRNGHVVLGCCRRCGACESQLDEESCLERLLKKAAEQASSWSPLERAVHFARQQRSWVIGEMMLADESLTREGALERYK